MITCRMAFKIGQSPPKSLKKPARCRQKRIKKTGATTKQNSRTLSVPWTNLVASEDAKKLPQQIVVRLQRLCVHEQTRQLRTHPAKGHVAQGMERRLSDGPLADCGRTSFMSVGNISHSLVEF